MQTTVGKITKHVKVEASEQIPPGTYSGKTSGYVTVATINDVEYEFHHPGAGIRGFNQPSSVIVTEEGVTVRW